jgi:outer membrane protein assembly factor BamA
VRSRPSVSTWIGILAGLFVAAPALPVAAALFDPSLPAEREAEHVEEEDAYDPFEGMDRNGRIPATRHKHGLVHPERWRYVPEGRIKPGNLLTRFLVTSFIVPYVFSNSDVGTGFGLVITDLDFRHKRRREFVAAVLSYTTEGQQDYSVKWKRWLNHTNLPDGGILQDERSFVQFDVGYLNTLTLRFFGLGAGTDPGDETSYSDESIYGDLSLEKSLPDSDSNWVMSAGLRAASHNLGEGHVNGYPSTGDVYPGLFGQAENQNMTWLRAGLRYDTRDSQETPYEGWHAGGTVAWAAIQSNGDMGARYTLKGGKIIRVYPLFHRGGDSEEENPPTDTLALHLRSDFTSGSLPFFALPTLGGSEEHRGFIAGRFRDRAAWFAAAEYRFWLLPRGLRLPRSIRIERIGAAFFYEAGAVSDGIKNLYGERVRHSYGVSLRISIDRSNPLRFDFGFSEEGMEFTLGYGLTF